MASNSSYRSTDEKFANDCIAEKTPKSVYYKILNEAVVFYSTNADMGQNFCLNLAYDLLNSMSFEDFNLPMRKAVVALAYIYRGVYRTIFKESLPSGNEVFEKFEFIHAAIKRDHFMRFLSWIAYLFELSTFYKFYELNYIEIWELCSSRNESLLYFLIPFNVNGLSGLRESCNYISELYLPLISTFDGIYPYCDFYVPFTHVVRKVEREYKYDEILMKIKQMQYSIDPMDKNLSKFLVLSTYDPQRIYLGCIFRKIISYAENSETHLNNSRITDRNLHLDDRNQESVYRNNYVCMDKSSKESPITDENLRLATENQENISENTSMRQNTFELSSKAFPVKNVQFAGGNMVYISRYNFLFNNKSEKLLEKSPAGDGNQNPIVPLIKTMFQDISWIRPRVTDRNLNLADRNPENIEAFPEMDKSKKSPFKFDDQKSFFVVTDRYLSKQKEKQNTYDSKYKRDIKIFSPIEGDFKLADKHLKILNKYIEKGNIDEISKGIFAVYPSNSKECFSNKIIVLDTSSSDDEESLFEPRQKEFIHKVIPVLRKWKYFKCDGNDLKKIYESRANCKKIYKPFSNEETQISTRSSEVVPERRNSIVKNTGNRKTIKCKRENKHQKIISVISAETKSEVLNSVELNNEKSKIEERLFGSNQEAEISKQNKGSKKNKLPKQISKEIPKQIPKQVPKEIQEQIQLLADIGFFEQIFKQVEISKQTPKQISENIEGIKTFSPTLFPAHKNTKSYAFTPVSSNTQQETSSEKGTGAIRNESAGQKFERSETATVSVQQKDISVKNSEVTPELKTSTGENKNNLTDQRFELSKKITANIQKEQISTKNMEEAPNITENTGTKGKQLTGRNSEKRETATVSIEQKNIPMKNTGAIPKIKNTSLDPNKTKRGSKPSFTKSKH